MQEEIIAITSTPIKGSSHDLRRNSHNEQSVSERITNPFLGLTLVSSGEPLPLPENTPALKSRTSVRCNHPKLKDDETPAPSIEKENALEKETHSTPNIQEEHELQIEKISESIRNELTAPAIPDPYHNFFKDLSGWDEAPDTDLIKTLNLEDGPCYEYLLYSDGKKETSTDVKKAKKIKSVWSLLETNGRPKSPRASFRSKNEWGAEEDHKPYALAMDSGKGASAMQVEEGDDDLEDHVPNNATMERTTTAKSTKRSYPTPFQAAKMATVVPKVDKSRVDTDLSQLLSAVATMSRETSFVDPNGKRSVKSAAERVSMTKSRPSLTIQIAPPKGCITMGRQIMGITGQKYHGDTQSTNLESKIITNRPFTADKNATALPRINSAQKVSPKSASNMIRPAIQSFHSPNTSSKDGLFGDRKTRETVEIPKWYTDSGVRSTYDQNLIRFMEIMGNKSKLRSPRKLSASGFQSLAMPNQPPESRGFVIEKKSRVLADLTTEIMEDSSSLNLNVLKMPIASPIRCFREQVLNNRDSKQARQNNKNHRD